eukprot:CAMPEP_0173104034 /NCGR_PEP_ID=MMETSP1102-20130122/38881_1 /TAXON_ID=49646 /ORGANISM="Geminigera sp., Strain Caron Lab Isolate" /LENGTH=230 /DNA_ID=CAMNT_0013999235 /DNA_START=149 /DNA_END=841 /DNA_ORIENTATION=+
MSRSSTTSTTSTVARSEKPGLRTPMTGYMGHVPGMVALNLHGGVWRDLILQDPLLNKPGLRPMSARSGSQTARASAPQRPMSAQSPKSLASESRRLSAEVAGLQWENVRTLGRVDSEGSQKENNFMPRMDVNWCPPVVGYGGHVPGYASGNLHGAPWKDLLSPTRSTGTASRGFPPNSSKVPDTRTNPSSPPHPRSRPVSAHTASPFRAKLPNNIAGYLLKHSTCSTPRV